MKDMWDILRATPARELVADLITLVCICVTLYALTVVGAGLVP